MANFYDVFLNKQVVLPVIHVEDKLQALKNAEISTKAGADGVFLIRMRGMGTNDI